MRYLAILLLLFTSVFFSEAQSKLTSPFEIETPDKIIYILKDSVTKTYTIDFNGDNKPDYISIVKSNLNKEPYAVEYWFNSDFDLYKNVDLFNLDYDYKYFVNLDNDSVPEIFRAQGYSDGTNFYFAKQNIEMKNETILFYFNPLIKDTINNPSSYYWGYPQTLKSIFLISDKGKIKLLCSLNHNIIRDGEIYRPENQSIFPAILFSGEPKSGYKYTEEINKLEWLTIDEIIKRIKK